MTSATPRSDRGNIVASIVSAIIVVVVAVGGSVLLWSVRHELPAEVATHWGADGKADIFREAAVLLALGDLQVPQAQRDQEQTRQKGPGEHRHAAIKPHEAGW